MGACDVCKKPNFPFQPVTSNEIYDISQKPIPQPQPATQKEVQELYTYESAICKIIVPIGKGLEIKGTGFFCEINEDDIPFKKALFTNHHILDETKIKTNKEIKIEYLNEIKKIQINKNRRKFTNKNLDYTCIEIFDTDKIINYFKIQYLFEKKNIFKDIFILQYPRGNKLSHSIGKIIKVENHKIIHNASTLEGSSGSPLIKRYNINIVLGIHFGGQKDNNLATPFDIIIKDIKSKLKVFQKINLIYDVHKYNFNKDFEENSEYSSDSKFTRYDIYKKSKYCIFGSVFVQNNKYNIKLLINGKECKLEESYDLKEGINNIQLIIVNILTNLEYMFLNCVSLKNIDELKYLNTEEVYNFSNMFNGCSSLSDINALSNWDVSNGHNFDGMFKRCSSLTNLNALSHWNVSNGNNFYNMFEGCSSLTNLEALKNWNVSNGKIFAGMFAFCRRLTDIKALENWNVSNGEKFIGIFIGCRKLSNIKALRNWNVSNGNNFGYIFAGCSLLSDINSLKNWNISKGIVFEGMFKECSSLTNIKALKNWNFSNGKNFIYFFKECSSLSDIKALLNSQN